MPDTTPKASTATYALLGLLAIRPWTGYELTQQAHRSLHNIWPTSEAHLYREQKRLVELGWTKAETEVVGKRPRTRYTITPKGRAALKAWAATEPTEPALEVEGIVRAFFGDQAPVESLVESMRTTSVLARARLDQLLGYVDEYLDGGGGPFPERLHVVSLAVEVIAEVMGTLEQWFDRTADEVAEWDTTKGRGLDAQTRERLERVRARWSTPAGAEPVVDKELGT